MLCQVDAFKILNSDIEVEKSMKLISSINWLFCVGLAAAQGDKKVMPEDHSELVPLLPIPNRTVKRLSADDSADTRVKVGHSQAIKAKKPGQ